MKPSVTSCNLFLHRLETKQLQQKYGEIIMDFSYFKVAEAQEARIENNEVHDLN